MKFRFFIYLNEDSANLTKVYPNYKDDLAKETELETNQRFYRDKISGKMRLGNSTTVKDFDFVMSQPFDTQYNLVMEKSVDYGQTWQREYIGKFFRTDCKINYDDQSLEFQPDAIDDYTDVLAGMEKESNLSDLGIEIQGIHLQKRPMIQVYIPGEEKVSCFLSGMAWEQDVSEATTDINKMTTVFKFSYTSVIRTLYVDLNGTPNVGGLYSTKTLNANPFIGTLQSSGDYRIDVSYVSGPNVTRVAIVRVSDGETMFLGIVPFVNGLTDQKVNFLPVSGTGQATGYFATKPIYARYLLDLPTINGVNTYPIPNEDLVPDNRNYNRVIGYAVDIGFASGNFSDEPTKWGKNSAGKYFLPPYSMFGDVYYPIARSEWESASYWFAFSATDSILETKGRAHSYLKDSYPISSVISALLKEYAPNITHEGTPEYSEFLYGNTNPIYYQKFRVFISQKTNLLNLQYQNPAQKTPMTMQNIFNMLRDCFRCFWYIEDNKLKIEHVNWFRNGGSYSGEPLISYDVTKMINVRNGKDWGFATSEITYDKVDMPERFQFKWMDDVSSGFEGMPIDVLSRYIMQGKIEEINVSNFNSDVDYLLLNPSEISQDGFVLMAAVDWNGFVPLGYGDYSFAANNGGSNSFEIKPEFQGQNAQIKLMAETISGTGNTYVTFLNSSGTAIPFTAFFTPDGTEKTLEVTVPNGAVRILVYSERNIQGQFYSFGVNGEYELPFVDQTIDGVESTLQNGIVAFSVIQPNFYVYDLPAKRVKINGTEMTVGVERKKKQSLSFPIDGEFDPMELVNTHVGLGQIDKISLNLHSRSAKTTLKYDTE